MNEGSLQAGVAPLLPGRYEILRRLGRGGGGEVWAVRDRFGGRELALKVLAADHGAGELEALIRETVALSGLEGLGLPRVRRFGRLADGRPYLVRELVEGQSLDAACERAQGIELVEYLARAADVLTHLHRAGLLHGDIKPANVIVRPDGSVTLVDLGLAAVWQDRGTAPEGLTPHYAAPEVIAGDTLTARSEVYSLGVVLREILASHRGTLDEECWSALERVVERSMEGRPSERYPSADEFASALRHAGGLPPSSHAAVPDERWPVEGMDLTAAALLAAIEALPPKGLLRIQGPPGSGQSTLLRRVAWTLSMRGPGSMWLDEDLCADPEPLEREGEASGPFDIVLADPPRELPEQAARALEVYLRRQLELGARLVIVGDWDLGVDARWFDMPALDFAAVRRLLRRTMPSLTDAMTYRLLEVTGGRPGALRRLVARSGSRPLASVEDLETLLAYDDSLPSAPGEPRAAAQFYLDRGRYVQARAALDRDQSDDAVKSWLEARWQLGAGSAARALALIEESEARPDASDEELRACFTAWKGRALLGVGRYADALEVLDQADRFPIRVQVEALAYRGLAESLSGAHLKAVATLESVSAAAEKEGCPRLEALVASSLATALWRAERIFEASEVYRRAIDYAERAGDAGILSSAQINLAALLKVQGELAASLEMLEAAVDTARRSGRRATLHQALLNLANADLYLGRFERARSSIEAIDATAISAVAQAQLVGLRAELAERAGQVGEAAELYEACEKAWCQLGRKRDAAEAVLESILVNVRAPGFEHGWLQGKLQRAQELLGEDGSHRPLLLLAGATLLLAAGDEGSAESHCEEALQAAEAAGQREWIWRSLELSAELLERTGRMQRARQARQRALQIVEDIGASLPRDLREVYWNDPRRRQLRKAHAEADGQAAPRVATQGTGNSTLATAHSSTGWVAVSRLTQTPLEQRLARILAVNHDLAGEIDLERLCQKIVGHARDLLDAERAFLLLGSEDGLTVQASVGLGANAQREFSRSIAQQVLRTGQPLVSIDASRDGRLEKYASVHQRMVRAVACVPVLDPRGSAIGALHLETHGAPCPHFADELPTLRAFGDQVAIALENARLLTELKARSEALEVTNRELATARERLEEVLAARTARLKEARRELRSTRRALEAHYTYEGLVGTSQVMRRLYSMLERIKNTDVPVLITGESGTGKEVVARALHQSSPRAAAKFLGVNCGAIPEQILESELFGHVRGAFTGADRDRKGLFREAEGGSLLLDEVGETPAKMQASLLRVLQERTVRPVGGHREEPVDVRVIFATNRNLEALVEAGRFREDLLYRVRVVELRLPALRERSEDIPQLVDHFFARFSARFEQPKKSLSREALHRLMTYSWPGNVRQLENVLLNAWVLSEAEVIEAEDVDLPSAIASSGAEPPSIIPSTAPPRPEAEIVRRQTESQHRRDERSRIVDALNACNWNRVKAAELIGMPRRTFYRRLHEYGIQ